ncbi:MAG TPA: hypothetical protein VKP30_20075 [Polyangiaceae bacterium]|nr:hypothetical protein [Polyangiaceae bacterium]
MPSARNPSETLARDHGLYEQSAVRSSPRVGGAVTDAARADEEGADAVTRGRDAGRQARLDLGRSGYDEEWVQSWLFGYLSGFVETPTRGISEGQPAPSHRSTVKATGENPRSFSARLIESRLHGSALGQEVRTICLDVEGLPVQYRAGDELAILPSNSPDSVREVLRMLGLNPQTRIRTKSGAGPIWQVLLECVDLERLPDAVYELMEQCASTKEERDALRALAQGNERPARSLVTLLRRFPRVRPGVDELLQSLERFEPSVVPIASACGVSSCLDALVCSDPPGGYGTLDRALLSRCQPGEWLAFSIRASASNDTSFESLTPVVFVSDRMGAAVVRAQLQQRVAAGHRGRSWILGLGAWGESSPYASDAAEWSRSGACRAIECLPEQGADFEQGFAAIEDMLWRWIVDHSSLYVAIADAMRRQHFVDRLRRLVAARSRVDEATSTERLQALEQEGRLIYWQPGGHTTRTS